MRVHRLLRHETTGEFRVVFALAEDSRVSAGMGASNESQEKTLHVSASSPDEIRALGRELLRAADEFTSS
jgi:hypothetical protein